MSDAPRRPAPIPTGWLMALALAAPYPAAARPPPAAFNFALVGDYNYGPVGGPQWQASARMIAAVNAGGVRFAVHLGDIKSGNAECSDAQVDATRAQFATFRMPLIYLFGDNEWSDCRRYADTDPKSPYTDPLERLAHLRRVFYAGNSAQGGGHLRLERQADTGPEFRRYVENVRWESGGVWFVGVNVPGSNNNYSGGPGSRQTVKVPGQDLEWAPRTAAVIDWLRDSFRLARRKQARAVVVLWQANPDLERRQPELPRYDSNGFDSLVDTLREQAAAFGKPVVLAHGDSHTGFRVDHPLPLPNLVRVENYGNPDTHWTRITVLPGKKGLDMFHFEGMKVMGNP